MELVSICRTCLATKAPKDISELKICQPDQDTCLDILLFCLNIKVEGDSKVSTKLCSKCFKKIMSFYEFKLFALKNDAYLKTAELHGCVKNEVFLQNDDIKNEDFTSCESDIDGNIPAVKIEPLSKEDETDCQSDNELLSVIKNIKYEFIPENTIDEIKENEPTKKKMLKRVRPLSLKTTKNNTSTLSQVCEECGKTVKNLKEHAMRHMPESARKRYPCNTCHKTFASSAGRKKHHLSKHLGIKKTCPICDKKVANVSSHTLLVHKIAELRFECASCARRFISRSALAAHTSVHTKDRPHACDECGKKFRIKLAMQQHRRQVHDKEKIHLCQFCSKSFFKKYHLQVHLRSHTKEKPYRCQECDKCFATSTSLNNHRSVHSDVKSFVCNLCSMSFARSGYLRVHMISHTKEKKHPCKYCGLKFGRSDHRKRHEFTAHERNSKDMALLITPETLPIRRPVAITKQTQIVEDRGPSLPGLSFSFGTTDTNVNVLRTTSP